MFMQFSKALTVDQFRDLALEMVDDLEKAYGAHYMDNGVKFDLSEYRNLIKRTKIEIRSEKIENLYQEYNTMGEVIFVREMVDAVNYFPNEAVVQFFNDTWDEKFERKKINDLKIMIHHEFVPFFTKKADRNHEYSKKLRAIYNSRISLENLKPGFYEIMHFDDPISSSMSHYYWVHINYNRTTKQLAIQVVENPLNGIWCLDCYLLPVNYIKLDMVNQTLAFLTNQPTVLSISKMMGTSVGFEDYHGYPYIKMLTEDSFGLGFMDSNYKGTIEQWASQNTNESRLSVMTRVNDVSGANWLKENKKMPIGGMRFSREETNCASVHQQLVTELVDLCINYGRSLLPGIDMNYCQDKNVKIIDVKQEKAKKLLDKFHCAYVAQLEPSFTGIPSKFKAFYQFIIEKWQNLLEEHQRYSH